MPPRRVARFPLLHKIFSQSLFADRRLVLSSAIVAGGFLLGKVTGLLRQILIARAFGTSADLDAFVAATTFSDLLFSVIAGGAIASVFIPVFSGYLMRDQAGRSDGWRFASAVLNDIFLLVTALSAFGMLFAQQVVDHLLVPCSPPPPCIPLAERLLMASLLRLVLISTIVFGVSGTLTGILHAHNHFVLPALAPAIYNLGIIGGALFLAPRFGIYGLAYGVVVGSGLHLLIQLPGLARVGARYFLTIGASDAGMRHLLGLSGPRAVTMVVVRLNAIIMNALALRIGEGSVSALSYAYSIWQFPESLIGTAIALAVFPRLAAHIVEGKLTEMRTLYRIALASILGLATPAALVLILLARPVVSVLLQRGAFGSASTDLVTSVLQFYALAIVGESLLELTSRIFYAQHDSRTPMLIALASMILRAALMFAWVDVWGARGLALAYAVGVSVEAGALYLLARRRLVKIEIAQPAIASPPQLG
jgi:putative peptidoglycan lipid II flippase